MATSRGLIRRKQTTQNKSNCHCAQCCQFFFFLLLVENDINFVSNVSKVNRLLNDVEIWGSHLESDPLLRGGSEKKAFPFSPLTFDTKTFVGLFFDSIECDSCERCIIIVVYAGNKLICLYTITHQLYPNAGFQGNCW